MENLRQHDGELILLGRFLHKTASEAKDTIDALPADVSPADEWAAIETISAPVHAIAKRILNLPADGKRGKKIKALADAWLEGTYWRKVA